VAAGAGLEIHRPGYDVGRRRACLRGSLQTASTIGFTPATIIDVGAARGLWSLEVASIWPDASYFMIDALAENSSSLCATANSLANATWRIAAVGATDGMVTFNVHQDLDGSTLYEERERNLVGESRQLLMTTVDSLVRREGLRPPFLLKADVQGAELDVIQGARSTLADVEMVILEVLLFDFFQGRAPQFARTVAEMSARGFVAWDIFGLGYRPYDGALSQADVVFVKHDGVFRTVHQYATEAQRVAQLDELRRTSPERLLRTESKSVRLDVEAR